MSQAALARRLGVSSVAVTKLEHAETTGGVTLAKLRAVAAALDCTLVYAIVPITSLEETVRRQARIIAADRIAYAASTMALEDQAVPAEEHRADLDRLVEDLVSRGELWNLTPRTAEHRPSR